MHARLLATALVLALAPASAHAGPWAAVKSATKEVKLKVGAAGLKVGEALDKARWQVRRGARRTGDEKLDQVLQARFRWDKGRKLGWDGEEARAAVLDEAIARNQIFAVAAQKGARSRVLRQPDEVEQHARSLDEELGEMLPPQTHREVKGFLDAALAQVRGKALYARRGGQGLVDLLSDEMVASAIATTPEQIGKLAVAIEAVRKASTHSLHAVHAGERPLELQYALRKDPPLAALLDEARADGVEIYFRRAERTPHKVLEAINRIAVLTQENYLLNWLPPLLKGGKAPVLTFSKHGLTRGREGGLIDEHASEQDIQAQLQRDVETIRQGSGKMMGFVLGNSGPRHAALAARLQAAVDDLRLDHALNRMLFDNADERTHDAQEVVKKMMWVGPIAHSLELMHLGTAAKLFASSADDLMGEWAEIKALRGSGYGKKEILKRLLIAAPVFGLATYGAYKVESLLQSGNEMAAGAIFGASAVALSLTTAIQSMFMYKRGYDELVREGKIDGKHALAGDPAFQKVLRALERTGALVGPGGRKRLIAEVERHLDGLGGGISAEDKAALLEQLAHIDLADLAARMKRPSAWRRWKEAIRQDFSNPTRLGIMIGASMAPLMGIGAAKLGLMHNGFVMAAVGSTESLVAGLTVTAARKLNDWKQTRALRAKVEALPN